MLVILTAIHILAYFFDPIPGSSLYICAPLNVPAYFREVWIPLFVHEVLLMALAVFKGIQIAREHGKGGYMAHFTLFLVRDSVLYYFRYGDTTLNFILIIMLMLRLLACSRRSFPSSLYGSSAG